ncbi:nucleotide-diphospho-sugar transferase [Phellopilus nigrolimitatus]|nr:nucleotide-diphospho-sugar transferase [Phellopilus nigrolimitatus]
MSSSRYGYAPLFANQNNKKWVIWTFAAVCAFLAISNVFALMRLYVPPSPLDNFHQINHLSPVHESLPSGNNSDPASSSLPTPEERAVVTTIYSESFAAGILTLGHSLQAANTSARLMVLYIPGRLSSQTLCRLQAGGWETLPIPRIPPPNGGKGVHTRFHDQYSKLQIWGLDKLGIKSVVYLDGDTLVRKNFDELWSLPFNFAAVPDVYTDNRGFALTYNAGVMFLRTSSAVMDDMLSKIETAEYRHLDAEQGFLNTYFATQVVRLPYIYNANLALKQRSASIWHAIEKDMRVVHYTVVKPFPETDLSGERKLVDGGFWETEIGWWEGMWTAPMMPELV